jgi:uncharacterized membrane protein (DUF2068 family)
MRGRSYTDAVARASVASQHRGLQLIAAFKFVKAAVLIAAGFGALGLWGPWSGGWVQHWLEGLALNHGHRLAALLAERALALVDSAGPRGLHALAVGAFLYATIFVVEGYGLARTRRWAEYLTVAVTITFLPIELVAVWHRWTLPRVGTIVLNIGVVVYLLVLLRAGRQVVAGWAGGGVSGTSAAGPVGAAPRRC